MPTIGKYELHEILGKGGFGTVYRATDRSLEREVAVKVLHAQLAADGEFVERFRREARIAARLDHPHTVPIYEVGEEDGRIFLVMKYMPGASLKQAIQTRGPIPYPEALSILEQTGQALDYIHAKNVIHRDLKPGNILFDEYGVVRLSDFGLAKALEGGDSASTTSASFAGTPPYTAPELWRNQGVSPASDLYSLGCIFFEMLTGKVLFEGDSPAEIMTRHVLDGPKFSAPWPEGVPGGTTEALSRILEKEPAKRFAHAQEFVRALSGPPVTLPAPPSAAPRPSNPEPLPEPANRVVSEQRKLPIPGKTPESPPFSAGPQSQSAENKPGGKNALQPEHYNHPSIWWTWMLVTTISAFVFNVIAVEVDIQLTSPIISFIPFLLIFELQRRLFRFYKVPMAFDWSIGSAVAWSLTYSWINVLVQNQSWGLALFIISGGFIGSCIGGLQWIFLRRYFSAAVLWILGSAIGLGCGFWWLFYFLPASLAFSLVLFVHSLCTGIILSRMPFKPAR